MIMYTVRFTTTPIVRVEMKYLRVSHPTPLEHSMCYSYLIAARSGDLSASVQCSISRSQSPAKASCAVLKSTVTCQCDHRSVTTTAPLLSQSAAFRVHYPRIIAQPYSIACMDVLVL
ncbi:uncharacterized protein SEPMUDRAFT_151016 [Sphaerulina musiva SO2202]|uniref:Uncharacterized protein n=1 Tax=Sphaerulina musiva (strain SO2202) TaxID=692275 RepID=M3AV17_SPHMS|nr:uncharacterized protein SEPMUDRAFT_151016 [Sphaerulina musiva SO2202]EMF09916.1 hypothetical protein SEPMUDRAFT_151016 [Sphaerulina musiva SO2202]